MYKTQPTVAVCIYVYMLEQSVVVCELYMPEHCVASCTCQSILWQCVMSEKWKSMHTVAVCKIVHAWALCGNLLSCTCRSILWQFAKLYMSEHSVAICWVVHVRVYCGSVMSGKWKSKHTVAVCEIVHARAFCGNLLSCTCQSILWQCVMICMPKCSVTEWKWMSKHTVTVCEDWHIMVYCDSVCKCTCQSIL